MPRDLPLGNGSLLVNFGHDYSLRDIYWPHVGQDNHTLGYLCHTGAWVDGQFSWIESDEWQKRLIYESETLVTHVTCVNDALKLTLLFQDTVDFDRPILVRKITVTNDGDAPRSVRLFFHYDWHIWENEAANTVYYAPQDRALIAYKGRAYFLMGGQAGDSAGIHAWATGIKEFNGAQGTWKDAEDGELGGNPIAQGSVDGTLALHTPPIAPHESATVYHWLAVGESYRVVRDLDRLIQQRGPQSFIDRTHNYWHLWVNKQPQDFGDLPPEIVDLYKRSVLIIRTQIDNDGAITAANDADVYQFARDSYSYIWPRDGALVANALSHAGYSEVTREFFNFCARVVTDEGYLLHKYMPDGAFGSSWHPWIDADGHYMLPIQEDETALVVYSLWQHYALYRDVEFVAPLYRPLIKAAADFMVGYREPRTGLPAPSYDLWEERRGILTYTVAAVYAGLQAAANFTAGFGEDDLAERYRNAAEEIKAAAKEHLWDEDRGTFLRMINVQPDGSIERDTTLDAATMALFQFGMFPADSAEIERTMQALEQRLWCKTEVGGMARYENDRYHQVSQDIGNVPGNPWFICTLWLAQYRIAHARNLDELHSAVPLIEWVRSRCLASGVLAEQVNPYTDEPLSVSPLTWSHAEFVLTVRWYAGKHRRFEIDALAGQTGASEKAAAATVDEARQKR
jgi:GH15 family glucan-1,4-alpha-glucosidase